MVASIQGRVVEYWTRRSIKGAIVTTNGRTAVTNSAGMFVMDVPLGTLSFKVTHPDFSPYVTSLNITRHTALDIGEITLQSKVKPL
jgi:hypothetical protein